MAMTVPKWLRGFDLSLTEIAIRAIVVLACVSALVELLQGIW